MLIFDSSAVIHTPAETAGRWTGNRTMCLFTSQLKLVPNYIAWRQVHEQFAHGGTIQRSGWEPNSVPSDLESSAL